MNPPATRTIQLTDPDLFHTFQRDAPDTLAALGYLITWGMQPSTDTSVKIFCLTDGDLWEMRTVYSPSNFVMGAIFRHTIPDSRWEFHS